ncbi:MAG: hypothetical protein AAFR14_05225 [Bacteroidota bacterium]
MDTSVVYNPDNFTETLTVTERQVITHIDQPEGSDEVHRSFEISDSGIADFLLSQGYKLIEYERKSNHQTAVFESPDGKERVAIGIKTQ